MSRRDALKTYRGMRVAGQTPEPGVNAKGAARKHAAKGASRFVVQLHFASHRHFDFRLELDGTLRSWAVPKGPSLDPAVKRLAVQVEDHPVEYGSFEGSIPEGHYGAGEVNIWDAGSWTPDGGATAARAALKKGHLDFELHGERLHGRWSLIRTAMKGSGKPNWLLIKHDDAAVKKGDVADDTALDDWLRASPAAKPSRPKSAAQGARSGTVSTKRAKAPGVAAPFPKTIDLPLARLASVAPTGDGWLHEIKFDGYRVLLFKQGRAVRIDSRNGVDYTANLPAIVEAVRKLAPANLVLDGELVALDGEGRSRFGLLQQRLSEGGDLQVMLFDLPHLAGRDLRDEPLHVRKAALAALDLPEGGALHHVDHHEGDGQQLIAASCKAGLEGLICKAVDSKYVGGRSGDWIKLKCIDSAEFVVVGYTQGKGARAALGSLLLALPAEASKPWRYVGRVGSGLDDRTLTRLKRELKPARTPVELDEPPTRAQLLSAKPLWVKPALIVEIEHRGWTEDGRLRQAAFKTFRDERTLAQLRREAPPVKAAKPASAEAPKMTSRSKTKESTRSKGKPLPLAGRGWGGGSRLHKTPDKSGSARAAKSSHETSSRDGAANEALAHFSHPDRVLFDDPLITKAEIGAFYRDIAAAALPGLIHRPLSLVRCPQGIGQECFFQKHLTPGFGDAVREFDTGRKGERLPYIEDLAGLLGLIQMNVVEFHPWGARTDDVERPDRLVFDLDPAPDVKWSAVIAAARELRERLAALRLESFVRTSGGKGLHVVLPLAGKDDWGSAKSFTHAVAQTMSEEAPDRYLAVATKQKRRGRIFIDYLRNGRGATSVASYSLRARKGAPVSVPLRWDELGRLRSGAQFTFANLRQRLKRIDDPWAGIDDVQQALPRL